MGQLLLAAASRLALLTETACHEAGHAVIARRLGYRVTRITLRPDGSGLCSTRDPLRELRARPDALDVFVAGVAAQAQLTGRWDWASADYDLAVALSIATEVRGWSSRMRSPRARVGDAAACVRRLCETDDDLWREVRRLAKALVD